MKDKVNLQRHAMNTKTKCGEFALNTA